MQKNSSNISKGYNSSLQEYKGVNGLSKIGNFIYSPQVEGKMIKEIPNRIKEYFDAIGFSLDSSTRSKDGSKPKSKLRRAYNFAKSPQGILLIGGLISSGVYASAAAAIGNRPAGDLPTTPKYYGRSYDSWAFPLNPNVTGEGPHAVARNVVINSGNPRPDLVLTNVIENLKANSPAYAIPTAVGISADIGIGIAKKSKNR
jgi:hypothetical protein